MGATFDELIAEAAAAPVAGWDFSWFQGRATEERPSWGYARMLTERIGTASAVLDVQTGGGEVYAEVLGRAARLPATAAATESYRPNLEIARRNLEPFGATVADIADDADLPFPDGAFDVVASRHPTVVRWDDIARVLAPGGTYFAQQIGAGTVRELRDFLTGSGPVNQARSPERAVAAAEAAGLTVADLRQQALRMTFDDIGAVVYFLRKVIWTVPDFTVARYRQRLADLHEQIRTHGPFVAHAQRFLIEAHKPR